MAIKIIIEYDDEKQVEIGVELDEDKNWEEVCYQIGCKVAREISML